MMRRIEAIDILNNAAWLGSNEEREKIEQAVKIATHYMNGNWVSVKKRLPIPDHEVRIQCVSLYPMKGDYRKTYYQCQGVYIPKWYKKNVGMVEEECEELDWDENEYYIKEGWYERIHNYDGYSEYEYSEIQDFVVAWQYLPPTYEYNGMFIGN